MALYEPGQSGNPNGRPKGSRNRRTQEILDLIQGRGDKDPLDALSEIITTSQNPEHRISASNILAPYLHSKRSTAPTPRFIETPTTVPEFTSIEEAENYLAEIPRRVGLGELDFQAGLDLSSMTKNWIDAKYTREELQLKLAAQGGGSDQTIRIEGGMPALPGTNIIMDETALGMNNNGHAAIDHEPAVNNSVNGTNVSSALAQSDAPPANQWETNANIPSDT